MYQFPLIKLTVEGMRHEIVKAVMVQQTELDSAINEQIKKAIKEYNFEPEIKKAATEAIDNVIRGTLADLVSWKLRKEIEEEVRVRIYDKLNEARDGI